MVVCPILLEVDVDRTSKGHSQALALKPISAMTSAEQGFRDTDRIEVFRNQPKAGALGVELDPSLPSDRLAEPGAG